MIRCPAAAEGRLIDASLFIDSDQGLRLRGSRCEDCATVMFPAQRSCPRCTGQNVLEHPLATCGRIWASTIQRFTPKSPYLRAGRSEPPYAVGYVDLGGEVLVEARLLGDPGTHAIGTLVSLDLEPLETDDQEIVWTFAFTPSEEPARS